MIIDCHTHTNHSPDSTAPLKQMCLQAKKQQIGIYAITDHCECEVYQQEGYQQSIQNSRNEINSLKPELESSDFKLLVGVELAQPLQNPIAAKEVLSYPYDFVIGSIHALTGMQDFYFLDYRQYSDQELKQLIERYLSQVYEMVCWGEFDTLAHLTYPLRYINGDHQRNINLHQWDDQIREIFKKLIEQEKALELNTSGLRQKILTTLPEPDYIKLFHQLGGKYLTIGSDAHTPNDIGSGIEQGMAIAYQSGFRYLTYFQNRKPTLLEINSPSFLK